MLLSSFHQDGPIVRVILHKSHALLTFKDSHDARSAIRKTHYLDTRDGKKKLILVPADGDCCVGGILQPLKFNDQLEPDGKDVNGAHSILKLNDNCLAKILSFFNLRELITLEVICDRFQEVCRSIYKTHRTLNLNELALKNGRPSRLTLKETEKIVQEVGPFVITLVASKKSFFATSKQTLRTISSSISMSCKKLENILLVGFDLTNARNQRKLSQIFATIKIIKLQRCRLTEELLKKLLRSAKCLEFLDVSQNSELTGEFLMRIHGLWGIDLSYCMIEPEHFVKFCESNPQLRYLNIMRMNTFDETCFGAMKNLEYLEGLAIVEVGYTITDFSSLADLPNLKHLRMDGRIINGILLEKFANCKHLEVLDVIALHVDGNMVEQFANLQYLRVLKINEAWGNVTEMLEQFQVNSHLRELYIADISSFTDVILIELIKKCTGLRYIDLSLCYDITTDLLRGILPHLLETLGPGEHLEMRVDNTQLSEQIRRANDDDFIDLHGKIKLVHNVQKTKYSLEDLLLFNEDYNSFYNFDTDDEEWED